MAHLALENVEEARHDLDECLTISPFSTTCLERVARVASNEGDCAKAESAARQLIVVSPSSPDGYALLAGPIFANTKSVTETRGVLEQRWARMSNSVHRTVQFADQVALDTISGRFDSAIATLDKWEASIDSMDAAIRGLPASWRLELSLEKGHAPETAALARSYQQQIAAWTPDEMYDPGFEALRIQYLVGDLARADFHRKREDWIAKQATPGSFLASPNQAWIVAYAGTVRDRADAVDALNKAPREHPLVDANLRDAELDFRTGYTYLSAGRVGEAIPHLRRAIRACSFENPLAQMRASAALGDALQILRDSAAACKAYDVVLKAWPDAPSVTVRHAQAEARRLACRP
jgi:tetratricopeptide (TPR) repeat protein